MDKISNLEKDLSLINKTFGDLTPDSLPVSFKFGNNAYRGIGAAFSPTLQRKAVDANVTKTVVEGKNADGVLVRAEITEYTDFPVIEWQLFFENTGDKPSAVLSELKPADFVFVGKNAVLHHSNGDTTLAKSPENAFDRYETEIRSEPLVLSSEEGTSCDGAFPYMRLCFADYTANIAIGWTGQWQASYQAQDDGVRFIAGQYKFACEIYAGETFVTPKITIMLTDTNRLNRAVNTWRRWYFTHVLTKPQGKALGPKSCMHLFKDNGEEFTGTTTKNQLKALNQYIERGMKPDVWWIDAGWYTCNKRWRNVGTWEADEERFPVNGLAPIGKCCEENGVEFLLWFEPERVNRGSWLADNHPAWCLKRKAADGKEHEMMLNLANTDACDWLIQHVDRLVKTWHVRVYRQDFNIDKPGTIWQDHEEENRIGAIENLHIQALYRFWDASLKNNPGLWIDNCASGGRRNDLEAMRRAVSLHYTDIGYGDHPVKQAQHQLHFEWIPYFRAHNMAWDNEAGDYAPYVYHNTADEFAYQNAFAPAITVMTEAAGEETDFELGRKMLPIWRKAAEIELRADYYPFTKSTKSNKDLYAVEFSDPEKGDGFLQVIRNTKCETETVTLNLHTDETAKYLMENPVSGETKTLSGKDLIDGFTVTLKKRAAVIWFYKKLV